MDVIVGGGVIGLSVAWRLARAGRPVTVVDPAPASGASHAAAGMLAPVSETDFTEEPLLRLGVESLRRWPSFAADLVADATGPTMDDPHAVRPGERTTDDPHAVRPGEPTMDDPPAVRQGAGDWARVLDYRTTGTLDVGFDADDLAALDELAAFMDKLGLPVERLTGRQCRRLEPMLAPSVRGGIHAPHDAWVDPRKVTATLLTALERFQVPLVRAKATSLDQGSVRLGEPYEGQVIEAERVILAAGAWSAALADLPVRPVKGQILRLRSSRPLLSRCVRGLVHGRPVYLVPRGDGELVVGATQEELGFDTRVTAGGVYELLRDARELVPGVTELELAESVAGLRPGTPDNLPLVGPHRGLTLATGHHRGGVLLAPLTAAIVLGEQGEPATLCSPERLR